MNIFDELEMNAETTTKEVQPSYVPYEMVTNGNIAFTLMIDKNNGEGFDVEYSQLVTRRITKEVGRTQTIRTYELTTPNYPLLLALINYSDEEFYKFRIDLNERKIKHIFEYKGDKHAVIKETKPLILVYETLKARAKHKTDGKQKDDKQPT